MRPPIFPLIVASLSLALLPQGAAAYPGGTPDFVTDVAPFCAGCHASVSEAQLEGAPPNRVEAEQAAQKHVAKILGAKEGPYAELGEAERKALVEGIQAIDAATRVVLHAPAEVAPGQEFDVSVVATGGGGPVIGIALVDAALRWQARPAASAGWQLVRAPAVVGPDGQPQTKFTEKRRGDPGISYVNVYGVQADPAAGSYAESRVTYRLRAPARPGSYPLAAALLYGTEKGAPHGAVKASWGGTLPLGGYTGNSGRVRFSEAVEVRVK